MPELLAAAAVIIVLVTVMTLIEYRVKTKGSLLTGAATPRMRLLALLLGIIFAVLFVGELSSSEVIHVLFPILALALIGYSLGARGLLGKLQGERIPAMDAYDQEPILPLNRIGRLLIILVVGVVLGAAAIYLAIVAGLHPESPLGSILIIGVIVLVVAAWLLRSLRSLRSLIGFFTGRGEQVKQPVVMPNNVLSRADTPPTFSSSVQVASSGPVAIEGDVIGGHKVNSSMSDLPTRSGTEVARGVTISGGNIRIQGDVVGGDKTVLDPNPSSRSGMQMITCLACGRTYIPFDNKFACPNCGTATPKFFLD